MAQLSLEDGGKALSTKNVKGNRLIVFAEYYGPEAVFKFPDGLDLEDKSIVDKWWVNYNTLYIKYVDGEVQDFDSLYDLEEDFKHPSRCEILPVDGYYENAYDDEDAEDGAVKVLGCNATTMAGATGYVKKEQTERVKEILATLDDLLKEDFDEYKSVFAQMRAKIRKQKKKNEPDNKPRCACGVWLRLQKYRDGGKCAKCVQAIHRINQITAVAGGE
jgi:hypothetical protein